MANPLHSVQRNGERDDLPSHVVAGMQQFGAETAAEDNLQTDSRIMLTDNTRLTPKSGEVAAKVIDGEAIIMNLSNGLYYSMDRVGSEIWGLIEAGKTLGGISTWVVQNYRIAETRAEKDVHELVARLIAEGLVGESVNGSGSGHANGVPAVPMEAEYTSPTLNRYEDMADLLALDPPMPGLTGQRVEE